MNEENKIPDTDTQEIPKKEKKKSKKDAELEALKAELESCLLYTSPSPRD